MANSPVPIEQNPATKQYFSTLPKSIQESLVQSGIQIDSEEQLRSCVDCLMGKK